MKCKNCGKEFKPKVKHQKFCCEQCRAKYWIRTHRSQWNNYVRKWAADKRQREFIKNLKDFKPSRKDKKDFNDFYEYN